jgi:hypothetical protein
VSLNNNPIFLTQKRLVYRGGMLAAILIAALIGCSLLAGLISYVVSPIHFSSFDNVLDAGEMFYGWTVGLEAIALVIGLFRISIALTNERKAGLWDSNRLTPLAPSRIIVGYWLGAPLREFYMGAILAGIGFFVVFIGRLPLTLWFGTQILILSTFLLLGLLSALGAMAFPPRSQGGVAFVVVLFITQVASAVLPKYSLTGFILPTYGIVNLFIASNPPGVNNVDAADWIGSPHIFGLAVYPIILTLVLQAIVGVFLWRMAVRKTANPFQSPLPRREAIVLFAIFLFFQHGLAWGIWRGNFPRGVHGINADMNDVPFLSIIHAGTLVLTVVVLAIVSPMPESIRLATLRQVTKNSVAIFSQSSVSLAIALTLIAAIILFSHFVHSMARSWEMYFIAVLNLLGFSVISSLLLEICRLRHRRRALGFLALWIFILCVLPYIIAGVLGDGAFAQYSLFSPGCVALSPTDIYGAGVPNLRVPVEITVAHLFIAVLLFVFWAGEWKKLLARAV